MTRLSPELLIELIELGWGRDNPAFRQVFTSQFIPGGSPEQVNWLDTFTFGGQLAAFSGFDFLWTDSTGALGSHRQPKRTSRGSESLGHGSQTPPNFPPHR